MCSRTIDATAKIIAKRKKTILVRQPKHDARQRWRQRQKLFTRYRATRLLLLELSSITRQFTAAFDYFAFLFLLLRNTPVYYFGTRGPRSLRDIRNFLSISLSHQLIVPFYEGCISKSVYISMHPANRQAGLPGEREVDTKANTERKTAQWSIHNCTHITCPYVGA